jgi:anti-sigma regulatory factor (Ser/Thr protein kinase)
VVSGQTGSQGGFVAELPARISSVEEGRLALLDYLGNFDIDAIVINRIEVILEELVSNVVRHGKGADYVRIRASCEGDAIRLLIEDNGKPFDPFAVPEPDRFTSVSEAKLGGQGVPLVKRLSRSVHYERLGAVNQTSAIIAAC